MAKTIMQVTQNVKEVYLDIEIEGQYLTTIGEKQIDIKAYYKTSSEKPMYMSEDNDIEIIVNGEYFKNFRDRVGMMIINMLSTIEFKKIVISSIRFINENILKTLAEKKNLEIVEFKQMTITKPMIEIIKTNPTLKVVIGNDIEDVAFKMLKEAGIESLTLEKYEFKSKTFNKLNLSKSSIELYDSLIITNEYDMSEFEDLNDFMIRNNSLKLIYIALSEPVQINFLAKIAKTLTDNKHSQVDIVVKDNGFADVNINFDIVKPHLGTNKLFIEVQDNYRYDINKYLSLAAYRNKIIHHMNVKEKNLTKLEIALYTYDIVRGYEIIFKEKNPIPNDILFIDVLKWLDIRGTEIKYFNEGNRIVEQVLIYIEDEKYDINGIFGCDVKAWTDVKDFQSTKFYNGFCVLPSILIRNWKEEDLYPIIKFLAKDSLRELNKYLLGISDTDLLYIKRSIKSLMNIELETCSLGDEIEKAIGLKNELRRIYVSYRTVDLPKKAFVTALGNIRLIQLGDYDNVYNSLKKAIEINVN